MREKENYHVADIALAPEGHKKIDWAWQSMPVIRLIKEKETEGGKKPLAGHTVGCCLHLATIFSRFCIGK